MRLHDPMYIVRPADAQLQESLTRLGTTTTIRGSRQTGKTSLVARGLHHARAQDVQTVFLDFQALDEPPTLDALLQTLALNLCAQLRLDPTLVERAWRGPLGAAKAHLFPGRSHFGTCVWSSGSGPG